MRRASIWRQVTLVEVDPLDEGLANVVAPAYFEPVRLAPQRRFASAAEIARTGRDDSRKIPFEASARVDGDSLEAGAMILEAREIGDEKRIPEDATRSSVSKPTPEDGEAT